MVISASMCSLSEASAPLLVLTAAQSCFVDEQCLHAHAPRLGVIVSQTAPLSLETAKGGRIAGHQAMPVWHTGREFALPLHVHKTGHRCLCLIAQPVGALSKYLSCSTTEHWQAAKGLLRYLVKLADYGITFGANAGFKGYCDADYARDV